MADTTTKKSNAKKADVSPNEQLDIKRHDLLEAKKSLAAGELVNPRIIKQHKKDIARLLTIINAEKESK